MREIKFRGYSKELNKWIEGFLFYDKEPYIYSPVFDKPYDVEDVSVGQFTGLLDKNNKEIYEGDIVKAKYTYIKEKPVYDAETGEFIGMRDYEKEVERTFVVKWRSGGFNLIPDIAVDYEIEVIGNIYENPNLLKQEV